VTAVWGRCTLHTGEIIEFDRCDSPLKLKRGDKMADGKENENRKGTEDENHKSEKTMEIEYKI
jgi:hypothetical protein